MSQHIAYWTLAALVAGICFAIICRGRHMDSNTRAVVRWQHGWLAAGCAGAVITPPEWRAVSVAAGVAVFLLLSSWRWAGGAPAGTVKAK